MNSHKEIKAQFYKIFSKEPLLVEAPGRINIIGEHTDYNDGFVLPAAIDKSVKFALQKSDSSICRLIAIDLSEEFKFSINEPIIPVENQWVNYFLGVIEEFKKIGKHIEGFNLMFTSDIPIGAGLSSSAAIECGFGFGLNQLFDLKVNKMDLALIGLRAEHNFAGVKCGIMDQFASLFGKQGHVIRLDCRALTYEYYPAEFDEYQLVLFDTQVKHNLADSEYNIRRSQCEIGLGILKRKNDNINSLRDVSLAQLVQVKNLMETTIFNRCKYVIEENSRVEEVCNLLKINDIKKVGHLMYETHQGLSNLYEVSCKELDFLVDAVSAYDSVIGARMMGGGFGGCTINLIEKLEVHKVVKAVQGQYLAMMENELKVYQVSIGDGVKLIN